MQNNFKKNILRKTIAWFYVAYILKINQTNLVSFYMLLWSPFLLVTSVVVLPIKGSTPSFVLAFFAFIVLVLSSKRFKVVTLFAVISVLYLSAYILSQVGVILGVPDYLGLILVHPDNFDQRFRISHLTQSLYLLPGLFTFLFFRFFYIKNWDKYLWVAVICLGIYGVYEFIYFIIFHETGDFLTNRTFGPDGSQSGSLSQIMSLGGFSILRLKSLVGEPSMYAYTVLPFWIYSIATGRKLVALFLLVTLFLSTSTTAFLGILIYVALDLFQINTRRISSKKLLNYVIMVLALICGYFFAFSAVNDLFRSIFDKLSLNSISGVERFYNLNNNLDFYLDLNPICKMFGIGFGTIRSTEMFSTLLVNVGVFGLFVYLTMFFYPIIKLGNCKRNTGIKNALVVILITSMVSVSEFSYLSLWIFLGLAYQQLDVEYATRVGRRFTCADKSKEPVYFVDNGM